MNYLAGFILFFLALRTLIALVNLLSGLHLPDKKSAEYPKVSVLIPARNEQTVLGRLLKSLEKQDYPDFEVIVCNDHSTDQTEEILNRFVAEDKRIQWFLGDQLPDNWLGKNYACHQLATKASGKYLIFLDADVELNRNVLSKAVTFFQEKQLTLLSVFPEQKIESMGEWLTVSVMNWILQSLLPMVLVQKTGFSSLSAANGQFMMFEAKNYRENQWHEKVKMQTVEDIQIARMIKDEGFRTAVLLGDDDIYCRMYHNLDGAVKGFSRNIHEYFGGNRMVMVVYWLIVFLGPLLVWTSFGLFGFYVFVVLVVLNRILISRASRQPVFLSVLLHPLQMLGFSFIVFFNLYRRIRKVTEWKGREIKL
jgi:chlorobactene glucosyltransferase